jgi:hypothetical protein
MNRRLFVACLAAPLLPDEKERFVSGREAIRRLWPPEPPDWSPAEFTAMLRAEIGGCNAFYEGLPITTAPYNHKIRAEYYSYGGWVWGWICANARAKEKLPPATE